MSASKVGEACDMFGDGLRHPVHLQALEHDDDGVTGGITMR